MGSSERLQGGQGTQGAAFAPEIVILCCQACLVTGEDSVPAPMEGDDFSWEVVPAACSSLIESWQVLRILERGAEGVELVGCPQEQCRCLVGSRRAERRVEYVRRMLCEIGLDAERVGFTRKAGLSRADLGALAAHRAEVVRSLGPSAMRKGELQ